MKLKTTLILTLLFLSTFSVLFISTDTVSAFDTDWTDYRTLTIDSDYVDTDLDNFMLLVRINDSLADNMESDGADLRFTLMDNITFLDYEIERWVDDSERIVWVKVPDVSSSADENINMWYNKTGSSAGQDKYATWDDYQHTFHMNDSGLVVDLGTNMSNSTAVSGTPTTDTSSIIGNGIDFNETGTIEFYTFGAPIQSGYRNVSLSGWFKSDEADTTGGIWAFGDTGWLPGIFIKESSDDTGTLVAAIRDSSDGYLLANTDGTTALGTEGNWRFFTWTRTDTNSARLTIRNDTSGVNDFYIIATDTDMTTVNGTYVMTMGVEITLNTNGFDGVLDEMRWYLPANDTLDGLNESYYNASYYNQNSSSVFLSIGAEQNNEATCVPTNSNPVPTDTAEGVSLNPDPFNITISTNCGYTMNTSLWNNVSGSWEMWKSITGQGNGTISFLGSHDPWFTDLEYGTTYYWSANTTDSYGGWDNDTYSFTTIHKNESTTTKFCNRSEIDSGLTYALLNYSIFVNNTGSTTLTNIYVNDTRFNSTYHDFNEVEFVTNLSMVNVTNGTYTREFYFNGLELEPGETWAFYYNINVTNDSGIVVGTLQNNITQNSSEALDSTATVSVTWGKEATSVVVVFTTGMTDVSIIGDNVLNIVGVVLIIAAIMSIVGYVYVFKD